MKLAILFNLVALGVAAAAPQVVVEPQALDLGTIREGEVVDVPFIVRNTGNEAFNIRAVRFSCGCLSMRELSPGEQQVEPGESQTLPIVYDTTGYSGERAANVVIMTDVPDQSSLMTDVKLFIETPINMRPRALNFGRQLRGAELPVEITMASGIEGADIAIVAAEIPSPLFQFEPNIIVSGEEIKITGTAVLRGDAPLGEVRSVLIATVQQGDKTFPVEIPLGLQVLGDMIVSPPMVLHVNKAIAAGAPLSELRIISTTADAPVDVLAVRINGPLEPADVIPEGNGAYRLPLTTAAHAEAGNHAATVDIFTTSKDTPVVTVPVYLWIGASLRAQPQSVFLETGTDTPTEIKLFGDGAVHVKTIEQDAIDLNVDIVDGSEDNPTRLSIVPGVAAAELPQVGYLNVVSESGESVRIPVIVR